MKYLTKLSDRWADLQDRRTLGAAAAVLVLDGGKLFSVSGAAEAECDPTSSDAVAQAALSLGLEADARVILLLPPGHFSTSGHQFARLDRGALLRALHFQQDELFPGMEPLVVTAACSPSLALWMRQGELERWQQAFALAGLKLLAIGPRNLLRQYMGETGFSSLDRESMLEATVDPLGDLTGWSLIESTESDGDEDGSSDLDSPPWKDFKERWRIRRPDYLFQLERSNSRPRLGLWLGLAAVAVGLLVTYAVLPLVQQLNLRAELENQVADLRRQAADVLTLREQVIGLEERLAPALSYPKTKIGNLLILLDENIPKESWLSSMRVTESIVEIDGVSPDPSRIIELLSARPEFSEVAFSKAIQQDLRRGGSEGNSRFGIRLKLAGIDFDGWRQSVSKRDE